MPPILQKYVTLLKGLVSGLSSWVPIILAAIAGILALIYKTKAEKAEETATESVTAAKDAPLVAQQQQDETKIKQVDENIQQIMDEREKLRNQYLTDQQKADEWNKK
jgi:type III secretory pathway component EscV